MGLKLIRLEYVRSKEADLHDRRHSYVFQAFLRPDGELTIDGYSAVSRLCKVIKREPGSGFHEGLLLLTSDGWMFSCDGDNHESCLSKLNARSLVEGDFVTVTENDEPHLFKVVSVTDAEIEILHA